MEHAGHAFEEHTSEVQVRLWGATKPLLYAEAAIALAELMRGAPSVEAPSATEPVSIEADSDEELLVEWLNELLYRTEMSGRLYQGVRIDDISAHKLVGAVGVEPGEPQHSVKAATFHGLRVAPTEFGFEATVILDV